MTRYQFSQFPCSHQQNNSLVRRVECKLNFQEFKRLITYRVNEVGQTSVVPITPYRLFGSIESDPFNPFCSDCHSYIVGLMKSYGHCDRCSNKLWQQIKLDVYFNRVRHFKEFDCNSSDQEIWEVPKYRNLYCNNDETLRAWVERASFEEVFKATPATKVSIEALTRSVIKDYEEDTNCVICLEGLYDSEKQGALKVTMPCKHEFHEGCIVKWLHTSCFCPLCRFQLPTTVVKSQE